MTIPHTPFLPASAPSTGPSSSFASTTPTLAELNLLKNKVIGDPSYKLIVLGQLPIIRSLTGLCRLNASGPGGKESIEQREARLEAVVIIGSLTHTAPSDFIPAVFPCADLVSNLLTSLSAIPSDKLFDVRKLKEVETVLRTVAGLGRVIGEYCGGDRYGTGVNLEVGEEDERSERMDVDGQFEEEEEEGAAIEKEKQIRELVGSRIAEFLSPTNLSIILSYVFVPQSSSQMTPIQRRLYPLIFQLLTALIQTSHHRRTLKEWCSLPLERPFERLVKDDMQVLPDPKTEEIQSTKFFVGELSEVLLKTFNSDGSKASIEMDVKTTVAALELLTALRNTEKNQGSLEYIVENHQSDTIDDTHPYLSNEIESQLLQSKHCSVRLASATFACAESGSTPKRAVFDCFANLLERGVPEEERVKTTFTIARVIHSKHHQLMEKLALEAGILPKLGVALCTDSGDKREIQRKLISLDELKVAGRVVVSSAEDEKLKAEWERLVKEDVGGLEWKVRLREGVLTALAALSYQDQTIRQLVLDLPLLLPILHTSLTHPHSTGIRSAACELVKCLSRSVSVLRSSLVDSGFAIILLELLEADLATASSVKPRRSHDRKFIGVRANALGGLANFVLEFSPMKTVLLDKNALSTVVFYCQPNQPNVVRLPALQILVNMAYRSRWDVKSKILQALATIDVKQPTSTIGALSVEPNDAIIVRYLAVLRNIVSGNPHDKRRPPLVTIYPFNQPGAMSILRSILERALRISPSWENSDVLILASSEQAVSVLRSMLDVWDENLFDWIVQDRDLVEACRFALEVAIGNREKSVSSSIVEFLRRLTTSCIRHKPQEYQDNFLPQMREGVFSKHQIVDPTVM
ncbi:Proteins containing armadillo/beta-catenin-like repeat [Phaffia rhodozyma]|uniref:Proteins containing armadillo/beta-catenin-like repeat n=1 Tax=Phaffia rhodozyma TaxID=264483 RepID=A0A0F7SSJ5_PHARH|nr:Proteins containing armadillo/beta-catenin-like repeat [Phaffia rhodozyma]